MLFRLLVIVLLLSETFGNNAIGKRIDLKEHSKPYIYNMPVFLYPSLQNEGLPIVFFISGDGGWASFNKNISETLAKKGIPVIGLDSRKFFWKFRSPEEAASKIAVLINHYLLLWKRSQFVLVGYSFGAGVAPFIAHNFQESIKKNLKELICLSPSEKTDFEVHISDMLKIENSSDTFNVKNELQKNFNYKVLCVFGDEEDINTRQYFKQTRAKLIIVPGKHDFNLDFILISDLIEKECK